MSSKITPKFSLFSRWRKVRVPYVSKGEGKQRKRTRRTRRKKRQGGGALIRRRPRLVDKIAHGISMALSSPPRCCKKNHFHYTRKHSFFLIFVLLFILESNGGLTVTQWDEQEEKLFFREEKRSAPCWIFFPETQNSREEKNYHQVKKPWLSPQATLNWIKKLCHPSETDKLYFWGDFFKLSRAELDRSIDRFWPKKKKSPKGSQRSPIHFLLLPSARKNLSRLQNQKTQNIFFHPDRDSNSH